MQVAPRENFGAGTDTIRDYALGMNSGNGPITRKDYIDIYLFAGYDLDVASGLGTEHYKTGMGQDQNTQGFAAGGVVSREKFGLGSSLKKFARKIIPNEVADIAVKAAPFVAPFNPAVAAAMSGIGTFDQTGSIGDSLKRGALTYGGGQAARYIGGAGFQGNPFGDGGAFTGGLQGFKGGFSSPLGSETGLGKFFSNRGTTGVKGINENITPTNLNDYSGTTTEIIPTNLNDYAGTATEIIPTNLNDYAGTATEALVDASDMALVGDVKQAASQEFNLFKAAADKAKNFDYRGAGNKALELGKKFGKAIFTDKDGNIDKAAVMGAAVFASSYVEAKALAADVGVDLTEEEYDEAKKEDKKEEYANYLTNFFGGNKNGGRIGFKFGSEPEETEIGIMAIDVEAGDDDKEENDLMAGITFSRAERAYLYKKLGGSYTSGKNKSMPNLFYILNDPGSYPADAKVLKEIAIMGMGKKDGGRIGFAGGSNRVAELLILRDEALGKGEDTSIFDAELFQLTGKTFRSIGGISDVPTGEIRKNNAGVTERDYRDEGGFVPVGIKERADDVPAMLSKNEFVMTADAVRGIGGGDVEKGSKRLYNTMKQAEQVGKA
jgi:hypothetical protein